jgi:hypothetical protein
MVSAFDHFHLAPGAGAGGELKKGTPEMSPPGGMGLAEIKREVLGFLDLKLG